MTTNEIALLPEKVDALVIFTGEKLDEFLLRIKHETEKFIPDVSTAKGRKEIAALAYKVAQSKIALDNLGKDLVADWKVKAAKVDASRRKSRDFLDNLKVEVRRPLTEWEDAEAARIKAEKEAREYDVAWDEAHCLHSIFLREQAIAAKEAEIARKEEEERLRIEAEIAEKARIAKDEQIRIEAAAKAKAEAEEAIARANRDRIAAEERAKIAAEKAEIDRAEERRKAIEDKEKAVKAAQEAERARIDAAERAREEAAAKAKAEAERLAANREHQAKINRELLSDIMDGGFSEDLGKLMIALVASGKIRHMQIKY